MTDRIVYAVDNAQAIRERMLELERQKRGEAPVVDSPPARSRFLTKERMRVLVAATWQDEDKRDNIYTTEMTAAERAQFFQSVQAGTVGTIRELDPELSEPFLLSVRTKYVAQFLAWCSEIKSRRPGKTKQLRMCFDFSLAPEGHAYWMELANEVRELTIDDILKLERYAVEHIRLLARRSLSRALTCSATPFSLEKEDFSE